MMKRMFSLGRLSLSLAVMIWLVAGCDSPSSPDLPVQPYHLLHIYNSGASPQDVCARGSYVAVANGIYGADVFRNTGADTLTHIFRYRVGGRDTTSFCSNVTLDTTHSYLMIFPPDNFHYPIFDYRVADMESANVHIGWGLSGPMWSFDVWSRPDTFVVYGTDILGDNCLVSNLFSRASDTSNWSQGTACPILVHPAMLPRGFAVRASDEAAFVTAGDAGVVVLDNAMCNVEDTIRTPGLAYDCALAGNFLVIADEYTVEIAQLTDPTHGEVISSLTVGASSTSQAHRLRHVTIDGNYACVSDDIEGVFIVDISNPAAPVMVQLLSMHDVAKLSSDGHGNLYIACTEQGLLHYRR
jgi:hypothetical protein